MNSDKENNLQEPPVADYSEDNQNIPRASTSILPRTTVKPVHDDATARIFVDGLSVLCPNESDNSVDIGFIREHHGDVEIRIYKGQCQLVSAYKLRRAQSALIRIEKEHPQNMGSAYEDSKKDPEDFGWMPDLAQWHGSLIIKPHAADHLSAKLALKDAVFYTHVLSNSTALRTDLDSGDTYDLGKLGRVLGADIFCDDEEPGLILTALTEDGEIIRHSLPKDDGPYFIVVKTEPEDRLTSHLHLLYDHIVKIPSAEPRYDFRYTGEEDEWEFCPTSEKLSMFRVTEFACQVIGGGGGPLPDEP